MCKCMMCKSPVQTGITVYLQTSAVDKRGIKLVHVEHIELLVKQV